MLKAGREDTGTSSPGPLTVAGSWRWLLAVTQKPEASDAVTMRRSEMWRGAVRHGATRREAMRSLLSCTSGSYWYEYVPRAPRLQLLLVLLQQVLLGSLPRALHLLAELALEAALARGLEDHVTELLEELLLLLLRQDLLLLLRRLELLHRLLVALLADPKP